MVIDPSGLIDITSPAAPSNKMPFELLRRSCVLVQVPWTQPSPFPVASAGEGFPQKAGRLSPVSVTVAGWVPPVTPAHSSPDSIGVNTALALGLPGGQLQLGRLASLAQ
jgi:hypothetical protein